MNHSAANSLIVLMTSSMSGERTILWDEKSLLKHESMPSWRLGCCGSCLNKIRRLRAKTNTLAAFVNRGNTMKKVFQITDLKISISVYWKSVYQYIENQYISIFQIDCVYISKKNILETERAWWQKSHKEESRKY